MPDLAYLHASLEMKARHCGLILGAPDPEVVLYVLVDVLGTNRSHSDNVITTIETLLASCECTYYAQDAKSGKLLFEARRTASEATYKEVRHLAVQQATVSRKLERTAPTPLPIDDPQPTTRPVLAKKKAWYREMVGSITGD